MPGTFLSAEWRYLAMLNYEVDRSILLPHVPRGTELDTWSGRHYISIVGFLFLKTRVLGLPIPFHRNFEEVNLRFYVRRKGPEGWRRGVVFIKEIVPRFAIAAVARGIYNENYVSMPMRHEIMLRDRDAGGFVEYGWRSRGAWNSMRLDVEGEPAPLVAGSEEEYITEHYWGYAAQRDGSCVEYGVEHPAWRVWRATHSSLACDAKVIYGPTFVPPLEAPPLSAFVAEGSPVIVRKGTRITS
jgi:uncharacterized protein YqjF (DUF2071 family)